MNTKTTISIIGLCLLSACKGSDGPLRHQYFLECLKALPVEQIKNPSKDLADVINACEDAAKYQSFEQGK